MLFKVRERVGRMVALLVVANSAVFSMGSYSLSGQSSDLAGLRYGPEIDASTNTASMSDSENLNRVVQFVESLQYRDWQHDPVIRPTGDVHRTLKGEIVDGSTHHRVRVYYSPDVVKWLKECRNLAIKPSKSECSFESDNRALPDGATMVKEMYKTIPAQYPEEDPVIGWSVMVKKNGASADGWFWGIHFKKKFRSMATMGGFNYSFCQACHSGAKSQNSFASYQNLTGDNGRSIDGRSYIPVAYSDVLKNILKVAPAKTGDIKPHRSYSDPEFIRLYNDPAIYFDGKPVLYSSTDKGKVFPSSDFDHVWHQPFSNSLNQSYITSSNCNACHNATSLVATKTPNMLIQNPVHNPHKGVLGHELLNLSVYGEWRSSPMGMSGKDPVFFAQLESEMNTYPEHSGPIQQLCLGCHGLMGERQYAADRALPENKNNPAFKKPYFDLSMVFATEGPHAKYGALARDGISCLACHQMDPGGINVRPDMLPTTGQFKRATNTGLIYGSTPPSEQPGGAIRTTAMHHALKMTPVYDPYINSSNTCGVCHVIQLNVLHPDLESDFHTDKPRDSQGKLMLSRAHEQNTYREWLFSGYQTGHPELPVNSKLAQECQGCHMRKDVRGNGVKLSQKVANIQTTSWPVPPAENMTEAKKVTLPPRPEVGRHQFLGMNLFVLTFYEQFTKSVFGIEPDSNPPEGTVPSQSSAISEGHYQVQNETASIQITDVTQTETDLLLHVAIKNKAGHKLPSGVGFRRLWVEVVIQGSEGKPLWASGMSNSQGVILNGHDLKTSKPLESEFTVEWDKIQPHWEIISREDQVQIYEERYLNQYGDRYLLNTSFLGIGKVMKDNRLFPEGFHYDYIKQHYEQALKDWKADPKASVKESLEMWGSLMPSSLWGKLDDKTLPEPLRAALPDGANDPNNDTDFISTNGGDVILYKIPLNKIKGAASAFVQLNYQNMPPYYLRDRFKQGKGGEQTQRLYYLLGHTKTKSTDIEGWKLRVANHRCSLSIKEH